MNWFDHWALTAAIFIPMIGVALMMFIPRSEEAALKLVALITSVATLGVGVYILFQFNYDDTQAAQFEVNRPWIDVINSRYHVFVDGIALPLLLLSMFITVL